MRSGAGLLAAVVGFSAVSACGRADTAPATSPVARLSAGPSGLAVAVAFGDVEVGKSSSRSVTVTNTGSAGATVSQLTVTGSGFGASGYTLPAALGPAQSGTFTVSFAPMGAGGSAGQLSIVSDAVGSPLVIALSGNGVVAPPPAGGLAASPPAVAFGDVQVGSAVSQTVTVTNTGTASATISRIDVTGSGIGASGYSLPATLGPGLSGSFTVSFAPAAAGSVAGYLSIVSDAIGSPLVIASTGTGIAAPPPAPTPGQLFYVSTTGSDTAAGTLAAPWRTIGHAAQTLTAGQTAVVLDGVYEEGQIGFSHSGTPGAPITVRAQNPWGAILSTVAGCNPAFSVSQSYITIEALEITSSPSDVACAQPSSAAGAVRCWGSTTPSAASPSSGYEGCTVRGIKVDRNPVFSVGLKTNQDLSLFENNVIYGSLEAFNNFGTVIRNNTVYDGDAWGSMVYGKGGVRSLQIYGNVLHMTKPWSQGVFLGGSSGGWWYDTATHYEAYDSVAYANVIINEAGGSQDALGMYGAVGSALHNNVVRGGHLFFSPGSAPGLPPNPYPDGPSLMNNIVDCGGGAATSGWTYTGALGLDYNQFYNCSSAPSQGHPILGADPLFVNPLSDWHLLPLSPALGAGTPLTFTGFQGESIDVSRNKDGAVRTVPWNLGVY